MDSEGAEKGAEDELSESMASGGKEITPKVDGHFAEIGISLESGYMTNSRDSAQSYDSDEGLQPSTQQPSTQPASTQPASAQPASTQQPPTQQPSTQQPYTQQPPTLQPPTQPASTQQLPTQPASPQPASTQPASTQQPPTQQPSTQQPSTQQSPTWQPPTQPAYTQQPPTLQPPTQPASTQQLPTQPASPQPASTQPASTQLASTQLASTQQTPTQQQSPQQTTQPPREAAGTGLPSNLGFEEVTEETLNTIFNRDMVTKECFETVTRTCCLVLAGEIKQREYVENITRQKTSWVQIDISKKDSIVPSSLVLVFYLREIRRFCKPSTAEKSAEITKYAQELNQGLASPMSQMYEKVLARWIATSSGGDKVESARKLESGVLELLEAKGCFVKPQGNLPDQWLGLKNSTNLSTFQEELFAAFNATKQLHFALSHGITEPTPVEIAEVTGALRRLNCLGMSSGYSQFFVERIRQWEAMIENPSQNTEMVIETLSSLMEGIIDQILIEAPCLNLTKLADEAIRVKLLGDQLDREPFRLISHYRVKMLHWLAKGRPKNIAEGMTFDKYVEIVKQVIRKILQACQNRQTGITVLKALQDHANRCIDAATRQEDSQSERSNFEQICLTQADTGNKHAETGLIQSKSTQDLVGIVSNNLPLDDNTVTCVTQLTELFKQQTSVLHISAEAHKAQVRLSEELLKKGKKKDNGSSGGGGSGGGGSGADGSGGGGSGGGGSDGGGSDNGESPPGDIAQRRGGSQVASNNKQAATKQARPGLSASAGNLFRTQPTSVAEFQGAATDSGYAEVTRRLERLERKLGQQQKNIHRRLGDLENQLFDVQDTEHSEQLERLKLEHDQQQKNIHRRLDDLENQLFDVQDTEHSEQLERPKLEHDQQQMNIQFLHRRVQVLEELLKNSSFTHQDIKSEIKQGVAEMHNMMRDIAETQKELGNLKTVAVDAISRMRSSKRIGQNVSFYFTEQHVDENLSSGKCYQPSVLHEEIRQMVKSKGGKMVNQAIRTEKENLVSELAVQKVTAEMSQNESSNDKKHHS